MKKLNIYIVGAVIILLGLFTFLIIDAGCLKRKSSLGNLNKIGIEEKIFFPHLSQDNSFVNYFGNQGVKLKRFNLKTQESEIIYPDDIYYTIDTIWSPDETNILLKNNQPYTETLTKLLDLKTKTIINLNKNIHSIIWSKDSQDIYYQFQDAENNLNYLAKAKYDGSNEQKIIDLDLPDYNFTWFDNFQKLGIWRPPTDVSGVKLRILDIQTNNITDIFEDDRLSKLTSSLDGQHFVYERFYEKDNNYKISYAKYDGKDNKDLDYQTPIQKVVWSADGSFFIVAVKEEEDENDKFYKVEIKNNKKTNLSYSTDKNKDLISAENLMLSSDNKTLYFTSNDILYSLGLK